MKLHKQPLPSPFTGVRPICRFSAFSALLALLFAAPLAQAQNQSAEQTKPEVVAVAQADTTLGDTGAAQAEVAPVPITPAESESTETVEVVAREGSAGAATPDQPSVDVLPVPQVEMAPTLPEGAADAEPVRMPEGELVTPTSSVTINLINLLVTKGILTGQEAKAMVAQAQAEADIARQESQAQMVEIAQIIAVDVTSEQLAMEADMPSPSGDDVRVTYVPEVVKSELREMIRYDVIEQARLEGWGMTGALPSWVSRIKPSANFRFRWQGNNYPSGNNNTGAFPNFNAINNGSPFDVTGNIFSPQINTDQNRDYFLTRVRFGAMMDLGNDIAAGIRVATGNNNSPVSVNQGSGTPGYFTKYALWLDRAFMVYELAATEDRLLRVQTGRIDNPFFSTPIIFDDDLGFDGVALSGKYQIGDWFRPFFTLGAFPVFNTDLNFASNNPQKFDSYNKYLFGMQGGSDIKIGNEFNLKSAVAYYYFYNIEGKLSQPIVINNASDAGPTDNSRPSFAQKGNTYMALRNIIPDANNDFGTKDQYQYFGLATPFQNLVFTGQLDWNRFEPIQVSLVGEFAVNLGWDSADINSKAVNNRGPVPDDDFSNTLGDYVGTNTAWLVELKIGSAKLQRAWDWSVGFGYRYIGSDAVVDSFNDSNFGLGGTNLQGFTVGGLLALTPNVWLGARWMGASSVAGPTYKVDVIQLDLNGKF